MKILVIPDVHTEWEKAEAIATAHPEHRLVFIGDYFDNFNDTPEQNARTAQWLKESLQKPNRIHLKGNHDDVYDPRYNNWCSGFTHDKKIAINSVLTVEDWDMLPYFHEENGWWFSHAGVTAYWFGKPFKELTTALVEETLKEAVMYRLTGLRKLSSRESNCIWSADYERGGGSPVGGILWCDWSNLDVLPGINQVVGHTPRRNIEVKGEGEFRNINVDCSRDVRYHELLEIGENGEVNIFKNFV